LFLAFSTKGEENHVMKQSIDQTTSTYENSQAMNIIAVFNFHFDARSLAFESLEYCGRLLHVSFFFVHTSFYSKTCQNLSKAVGKEYMSPDPQKGWISALLRYMKKI
jgi:hypothetical protein